MHIIGKFPETGQAEFHAFAEKSKASEFWSQSISKVKRGEVSGEGLGELRLFVVEADDEAAALKEVEAGNCEAHKTFALEGYVPLLEKARADENTPAIDVNVIAAAERDVENLSDSYQSWIRADLKLLQDRVALIKNTHDFDQGDFHMMRDVAYNLTGLGGTFDFPMVTFLGTRLLHYIEDLEHKNIGEAEIQILTAYIKSLKVVVAKGIKGNGGALGRKLLENLNSVIQHYSEAPAKKAKPAPAKAPPAAPEPKPQPQLEPKPKPTPTAAPQAATKKIEQPVQKQVKEKVAVAKDTSVSKPIIEEAKKQPEEEKTPENAMSQEQLSQILNKKN
ncbi:hypothetical protein MTBPR1_180022 [Candidatus Terasakiella magnetica]|uniref:Uncharacterized protein n=1 Tax=Candidatus Terasakiella magnetica TaxID=1867952 RepID=A0A1C3RFS2_9PROT|nr:hypothetical protein [Candidatus Terasakiella magnetica]SCA56109.1 hypothetical protein MTBPR1_180022 [Candidatus Terasakiella magnetica]